ncbi:MAG: polyamine transporter permease, partial [Thermomicrobiales bacterium]|nr:polyamine transporter permease [Thermomicrobiales bacterium]
METTVGQTPIARVSGTGNARRRWLLVQLLAPTTLALIVFFVLPLVWLFRASFDRGLDSGVIESAFTLENYQEFLSDRFFQQELLRTLRLGVVITALTLVATYPIALFLARSTSRWRGLLVALAIAPLLTSTVVRTYGWLVILGNDGLVNGALLGIGLIDQPLRLINDEIGVVIGLVEILMPYMALGLLSGFGRINPDVEEAAMSLGANPLRTFWRVTLPLSLPGIATGVLLVFVLTISSFVTPQLLGGGRVFLMATEIYDQATYTLDWPFAAAISFLLLLLFGVVIAAYTRVL